MVPVGLIRCIIRADELNWKLGYLADMYGARLIKHTFVFIDSMTDALLRKPFDDVQTATAAGGFNLTAQLVYKTLNELASSKISVVYTVQPPYHKDGIQPFWEGISASTDISIQVRNGRIVAYRNGLDGTYHGPGATSASSPFVTRL